MAQATGKQSLTPQIPDPCGANIGGAQAENKARYDFTPARRKALDEARKKRKFVMSPAKMAALRKATAANRENFRLTPARLRAMRANARKMQRGSVEKFQMTEARRRANAENIRKAQSAPRTPESRGRSRFNHLQHGLNVRSLEETMQRLHENPRDLEAHAQRFARVFAPADPAEAKVVREIADLAWRRLRLFKAQARWEAGRLKKFFESADFVQPLDAESTRMRAMTLLGLLTDHDKFFDNERRLTAAIERQLRMLTRLRAGGDANFRFYSYETMKERRRYLELESERLKLDDEERTLALLERIWEGDPQAIARVQRAFGATRPAS
jgi:hypothetical protein